MGHPGKRHVDGIPGASAHLVISIHPGRSRSHDLQLRLRSPGFRLAFGHLGDGNLHYNLNPPAGADPARFIDLWPSVADAVHVLAVSLGGTFSAEHGIGCLKAAELERLTDPVELDVMRAVKRALDPQGIMNPGKVLLGAADDRKD